MPLSGSFKSQARYWAGHAFFCAMPSFIIAVASGFDSIAAISGMLLGIAAFVVLYATVTSRGIFVRKVGGSLFGRAINLGAKVRSWIAVVGLLFFFLPTFIKPAAVMYYLIMPDMYAGMAAMSLAEAITGLRSYALSSPVMPGLGNDNSILTLGYTFLITVLEGAILSGTLFVVIILCLVAIALLRQNRRLSAPNSNS